MLATSAGSQLAALVRNVIVARYLGPEEFGLAATIILTVSFLDSFSNAGAQNLLVQSKEDDNGRLLAVAHGISLARGVLTTLLLILVVAPLAHFIDVGLDSLSICLIAISCLAAGLTHRGVRAVQRHDDFVSDGLSQLAGEIFALIVAVVVAAATHSHIAVVIGVIVRSAMIAVSSHVLVQIPYRISFSKEHLEKFWTFGWPLLINGPLVFLSLQADRVFVSATLGAHALGTYSAIVVLIASPSAALLKWLGTIWLPPLSRHYHERGVLDVRGAVYRYSTEMVVVGWLLFCGFMYVAPLAIPPLFGSKYVASTTLIALVGALQVLRFLRAWPMTLAISCAASSSILKSTVVRFLALPMGLVGVALYESLEGLILGFAIGELLTLLISLVIVNRAAKRSSQSGITCVLLMAAMSVLLICSTRPESLTPIESVSALLLTIAIGAPLLAVAMSSTETNAMLRFLRRKLTSRN